MIPAHTSINRSVVNRLIGEAMELMKKSGYPVPAWFYWTKEDWDKATDEYAEIPATIMGWDITDFGSGDFWNEGLLCFNISNGSKADPKYPKVFSIRICFLIKGQVSSPHWHKSKMEELINFTDTAFGTHVWNVNQNGQRDRYNDVEVEVSGRRFKVKPGDFVELKPFESYTMYPGVIHGPGEDYVPANLPEEAHHISGYVIEIASVIDDLNDNLYLDEDHRWAVNIVEDEPAKYYLVQEYPELKKSS